MWFISALIQWQLWYQMSLPFGLFYLAARWEHFLRMRLLLLNTLWSTFRKYTLHTSGFATTHVVVSVRHPITYQSPYPLPTSQIRWSFILERIKLTARVASIHAIFQLTVRRIQMFFSLKPSQSQGESSLKISSRWGSPFLRS